MQMKKLVVIGVGLIGGSLALDLKRAGAAEAQRHNQRRAQRGAQGQIGRASCRERVSSPV